MSDSEHDYSDDDAPQEVNIRAIKRKDVKVAARKQKPIKKKKPVASPLQIDEKLKQMIRQKLTVEPAQVKLQLRGGVEEQPEFRVDSVANEKGVGKPSKKILLEEVVKSTKQMYGINVEYTRPKHRAVVDVVEKIRRGVDNKRRSFTQLKNLKNVL